jgi:hypothetical protein
MDEEHLVAHAVHHLDLWVTDPVEAAGEWGWLLGELGWEDASGTTGCSWAHLDGTFLFIQRSPDQLDEHHDRLRPGLNHLALLADERALLDRMRAESSGHGWHELFADRYPHAGGDQHTALFLENSEGFEVEIVWE